MKRTTIFALLLCSLLLAACASPAPEYGKVVTPTEPPATSTPEATSTPTPRPDAREAVMAFAKVSLTYDAQVSPRQMVDAICQMASEYGCWQAQERIQRMESFYAKYPNIKSEPVITSVSLMLSGYMSDGTEYQVWNIAGVFTNWPEEEKRINTYPTFIWDDGWKYHRSPYPSVAQTLQYCGQFWEYAPDGRKYGNDDWPQVLADCQTATPLPPTPFVPVTPVFTPTP